MYCVANGALEVYFYDRILALFSATPFTSPFSLDFSEDPTDISAHLTNTSLQKIRGEAGVRLFDELVGSHIISKPGHTSTEPQRGASEEVVFTEVDIYDIKKQIGELLRDSFQAALGMSVHFQVRTPYSRRSDHQLKQSAIISLYRTHLSSTALTFWCPISRKQARKIHLGGSE